MPYIGTHQDPHVVRFPFVRPILSIHDPVASTAESGNLRDAPSGFMELEGDVYEEISGRMGVDAADNAECGCGRRLGSVVGRPVTSGLGGLEREGGETLVMGLASGFGFWRGGRGFGFWRGRLVGEVLARRSD